MSRIATMSPELVLDLSPADVLALDEEGRYELTERRETAVHDANRRIAELELELQNARRMAELHDTALDVARAVSDSNADPIHGRLPGDVLIGASNDREYLLLGVSVDPAGGVTYLVLPYMSRNDRTADGDRPRWRTPEHFLRP